MKLSPKDVKMLMSIQRCLQQGFDGIAAVGQEMSRCEKLERMGLARYVGMGVKEECPLARCRNGCLEDHLIYTITEAGSAALGEWMPVATGKGRMVVEDRS